MLPIDSTEGHGTYRKREKGLTSKVSEKRMKETENYVIKNVGKIHGANSDFEILATAGANLIYNDPVLAFKGNQKKSKASEAPASSLHSLKKAQE